MLLSVLEKRLGRLAAEGLLNVIHKNALLFLPRVVGVITSPTWVVLYDLLHRLHNRCTCHVLLWPVTVQGVQGEGAAAQVAKAINDFNQFLYTGNVPRPDVLIVTRGGGSREEPFNEESMIRPAVASTISLISAVGHETDVTLLDLATDCRAPTTAAERVVHAQLDLFLGTGGTLCWSSECGHSTFSKRRQTANRRTRSWLP